MCEDWNGRDAVSITIASQKFLPFIKMSTEDTHIHFEQTCSQGSCTFPSIPHAVYLKELQSCTNILVSERLLLQHGLGVQ